MHELNGFDKCSRKTAKVLIFHFHFFLSGQYFDDVDHDVAVKVVKWPAGEEEAIFRECFLLRWSL